jgi:hypothetical protein
MNTDDFCQKLRSLAPSQEALQSFGLSRDASKKDVASYTCRRVSQKAASNVVLDLCSNFDVSFLEIGAVRLNAPVNFDRYHWQIGLFEADPIVLPKQGGPIVVRDHDDLSRDLCVCATAPERFLPAMLRAAEFLTHCLFHPNARRESNGIAALQACVSLAGGKTSENFYYILLGLP